MYETKNVSLGEIDVAELEVSLMYIDFNKRQISCLQSRMDDSQHSIAT